MSTLRDQVAHAHRVVVKIGSSSLATADGHLDVEALGALADVLAALRQQGKQVVLVTSGSIAAGILPLGLHARPQDLATAQAAASVGQGMLIAAYSQAFSRHGITVGQVLLTAEDMVRRAHYGNAQRALERLLELGVLPIVNENDTVATDEIRFGDNDRLAALVATVTRADALVLLTDVDGLYTAAPDSPGAELITEVHALTEVAGVDISKRGTSLGTGGMVTKLEAARIATSSGVTVVLAAAARAAQATQGENVGTVFAATGKRNGSRLNWLAYAARVSGQIVVDDGAVRALRGGKASLLAAGVTAVRGEFEAGQPVEVVASDGAVVAKGLAGFAAHEIPNMIGKSTEQLRSELGEEYARELVHIDDLVLVGRG